MRRQLEFHTIGLFGNFGTRNLGNEYTLRAIIHQARACLPDAGLFCVCSDPADASARHGLPSKIMSYRFGTDFQSRRQSNNRVLRLLRQLFVRLPREVTEWIEAYRTLSGARMLIMPGTGMLGDFGISPLGLHYEILKWSIVARLRGARLLFVSVGAGPIEHRLSRWLVTRALSLAHYRSYRDEFSREYLSGIGFDTEGDFVYPDLAFSLVPATTASSGGPIREIGVGLMDYYGREGDPERGEAVYQRYLKAMAGFVAWLLSRDYTVRLLIGDAAYDRRIAGDVLASLGDGGARIIHQPVDSFEELIVQLDKTDLVVATRFHNVLLALMMGKPVVAISYHQKIASLMEGMGLGRYCQALDELGVTTLTERFLEAERNADALKVSIRQRAEEYRLALDEQSRRIFYP
jgi:polysaccharide pyruvyl transferase WcaK-like protein